jgi:ADP-ribosyl-[dinitrogen reductase] hydrolase
MQRTSWKQEAPRLDRGAGSLLAIPHATDRDRLAEVSRQSSKITHADPRCTEGCTILNLTVAGLLEDADTPLQDALNYVGSDAPDKFVMALQPLARGD